MTDWTAGYVADIGYTYGYYAELNPLRVQLVFLNAGLVPPTTGAACELGFGQGMSVNLHAAASVVQWQGTDFNPSQAAFAQELAGVSQSQAQLYDQAFDEFCGRDDLPEFDFIGLHGIWSWISDANRQIIVDFIRRKLKVGGVLYISYNTQPGWAAMVPVRDLLTRHADVLGTDGMGIVQRIDGALNFAKQLMAVNPKFAQANPQVAQRIESIAGQNRNYVAHEYFNRDWQPMSFARMAQWLESAKLQWACSANYLDAIDVLNLTGEQSQLLQGIPDAMLREEVRDFCVNQQFRKDYWVKGARTLTPSKRAEALQSVRFVLAQHRTQVSLKVQSHAGEATLQAAVYEPILDVLQDHRIYSVASLEKALANGSEDAKKITQQQLVQALVVLCGTGAVQPAQDEHAITQASAQAHRLNQHLLSQSVHSAELTYLASPVTGGGVNVTRFHQLFLLARSRGAQQPADWAAFAWEVLNAQNQRIVKDGKALATAEDNILHLTQEAQAFQDTQLPLFQALQLI